MPRVSLLETACTWECSECRRIVRWTYLDLAESGSPVCETCDTDMELLDPQPR